MALSPLSPDTAASVVVQLDRGELTLDIDQAHWPLSELVDFAERINPRRAFLFVSRVLGRHIPVAPARMQQAFTALAARVPDELPGPVLVIGMAETAVALGAGVHRALQSRYPDALYIASTRHPVPAAVQAPLFCEFTEAHSHAPAHLLYGSPNPAIQARLLATRTLILVDDEASTGQTFINLTAALQQSGLSQLETVITATLTDWSQPQTPPDLNWQAVSLLQGQWRWQDRPDAPVPVMPRVDTVAQGQWPILGAQHWGRLPTPRPMISLPVMTVQKGERILVLGSGEFVWPAFLLAEQLADQGATVHTSALTRSPVALGHAIQSVLSFQDNYGLGIANFVYNIDPSQYDRILLVIETDPASVDIRLKAALPQLEIMSLADQQ